MDQVINIVVSWWGLIGLIVALVLIALIDVARFKDIVFLAENYARKKLLNTNEQQETWAVEQIKRFFPKTYALLGEDRIRWVIKWLVKQAKKKLQVLEATEGQG